MDVKKVIKDCGFTLEKVGAQWRPFPITKGSLSKSINNNPTVATLKQIADIIGCDVMDFFRDEATHQPEQVPDNSITCPHCGKKITFRGE